MGLYDDDADEAKKGGEYRDAKSYYERLQELLAEKKDVGQVITMLSNTVEALENAKAKFPVLLKKDGDFKKWHAESIKLGKVIAKDATKDENTKSQWEAYGEKIEKFLKANK